MFSTHGYRAAPVALPLWLLLATLPGCTVVDILTADGSPGSAPTSSEIVDGLREALSKGTARAAADLAGDGGYQNDSLVRISFPPEAQFAADALQRVGLGELVANFEQRLNRGAEAGARRAVPIFEKAIRQMSFADAKGILFGGPHAATDYFRDRTHDDLVAAFRPEIEQALAEVGAVGLWTEISTQYNRIPFTSKKVDTDIVRYATGRALDGLFLKLAAQEAQIRAQPRARTTALLQKVFAYAGQGQ